MKENYDFSNSVKNPYTAKLKKQITIRGDSDTIEYFKNQASETGITLPESYELVSERLCGK